jgi:hypothetical protein
MIQRLRPVDRRTFIGGSDARIIMGADEPALLQLWREKRGELEPEDLSGNLIVQLGLVTEAIVADRSAPQKHVWRANIIPATADGCVPPRSRFFRRRSWCFGWCGGPGHLLAQAGNAPYVAAKSARTTNHAKNTIQAKVARIPIAITTLGQCRAKRNITAPSVRPRI